MLNKLLLVVLLASAVIVVILNYPKQEIKNLSSKGKTIICFGDSITFGYGVKPGDDYPTALSKAIDMPVINAGVDGDTTSTALSRIDADVLGNNPRLVIVEFCGNDFIKKVPKEITIKNIREIVQHIHARGAMVALVDISAGMFLIDYRIAFSDIARKTGAIFIPAVLSGIITNPSMKSDFLHPNAEGYQLIAERIAKQITPYIGN